ncbi:MAG: phytase [Calditrichia bacterium]
MHLSRSKNFGRITFSEREIRFFVAWRIVVVLILVLHFPVFPQGPACNMEPFSSTTISPVFTLDGVGDNVDTIDFWEAPDINNTLMFVTSKDNSLVEIWKYPFENNQQSPLTHSTFGNSRVNGVVVDQEEDLLYIATADPASTVSVFSLPDLTFIHNFNKPGVDLDNEPNLTLLKLPNGDKRIYLSSKTTVYIHDAASGDYLGEFQPEDGLETMAADEYHQVIYIPDEMGGTGVYVHHPDGQPFERNGSNNFGGGDIFDADAEGIWLYKCLSTNGDDTGDGLIIVSDQRSSETDFEVFDRLTWEHLGTFNLGGVSNTDGICAFQTPLPGYPSGVFAAIDDDQQTAVGDWEVIFNAIGSVVGIGDGETTVRDFRVSVNYPNPFNPTTTIDYHLPQANRVKLRIYNIYGQLVRELVNEHKPAGAFGVVWDGLNSDGLPVSSGVYMYVFSTPEFQQSQKMTLVR